MAFRWYVVNVYSGFETKVKENIYEQAEKKGMRDRFEEILIPSEEVSEVRRGQKVTVDRKYFPGYILIKMDLDDDTWNLVRDTPRVSSFLGPRGKPLPISDAEITRILKQAQDSSEKLVRLSAFEIGESVRITDGPFTSFTGEVSDIDQEKGRLKVSVLIFGRPTPVELEFNQVDRV